MAGEGISSHRAPCDPNEVVERVVGQYRPALERRGISVEWSRSGVGLVLLDEDAFSQVIWNLISNVEKYGGSGNWLGVTAKETDGGLEVRVCDPGEGITRAAWSRIFQSFGRVHDSTQEGVSGTGLGLSISRELAEAMGGRLILVDDPGMTVFQLNLPLS